MGPKGSSRVRSGHKVQICAMTEHLGRLIYPRTRLFLCPNPFSGIGGSSKEGSRTPSRFVTIFISSNTPNVSFKIPIPSNLCQPTVVEKILLYPPYWSPGDTIIATVKVEVELTQVLGDMMVILG